MSRAMLYPGEDEAKPPKRDSDISRAVDEAMGYARRLLSDWHPRLEPKPTGSSAAQDEPPGSEPDEPSGGCGAP